MKKLFASITLLMSFFILNGHSLTTTTFKIVDSGNFPVGTLTLNAYDTTNYYNLTNTYDVYKTNIVDITIYHTNLVNIPIYVTNNIYFTNIINIPIYSTNYVTVPIYQTNIVWITNNVPNPTNPPPILTNKPPTVTITSPANGQVFQGTSATINVIADARDPDGTISKVEFYVGTFLANTDTSSPFSYNSLYGQGNYALQVRAYDNSNAVTLSSIVNILVTNSIITPTNNPPTPTNPPPTGNILYIRSGATGNGSDWANASGSLPSTLIRGYTYYVAAGTYPGRNLNTPASGTALITIKKATASEHGTDVGWNSNYAGQASFTGPISFSSSYWVVDGVTGGGPNSWTSGFGFKITSTGSTSPVIDIGRSSSVQNIKVSHCQLVGMNGSGSGGGSAANDAIAIFGDHTITISYCDMTGIGRCPIFAPNCGSGDIIVEYCRIGPFFANASAHGEVAAVYGVQAATRFIFRYNLVTHIATGATGGLMWDNSGSHSAQMQVYGNVFYKAPGVSWSDNQNGIIGGWTGGNGEDCYNIRAYNNSFVNCDVTIFTGSIQRKGDNVFQNNLFYNCDAPNWGAVWTTHNYNHFIGTTGASSEANGTTGTGDPFVDYANWNFQLEANTPAGIATPYTTDALGNTRSTWTRGAYEFIP